eukprot:GFKZ01013772.1.p2 GENE.GFKZ01013772.1~~GFKZ01013772.1.p2  ORF type:complete len:106 (-),score=7.73 GFKZ01013772.1:522-839(-)
MFLIRLTSGSTYHAGSAVTFADETRILYSPPVTHNDEATGEDEVSTIANLIDGTDVSGVISYIRTMYIGAPEDVVLAQTHEKGVMFMFLKHEEHLPAHKRIEAGN